MRGLIKSAARVAVIVFLLSIISSCAVRDCRVSSKFLSLSMGCDVVMISDQKILSFIDTLPGVGEAYKSNEEKMAMANCYRNKHLGYGIGACEDVLQILEPYCFDDGNEGACLHYGYAADQLSQKTLVERAVKRIAKLTLDEKRRPKYSEPLLYWNKKIKSIGVDGDASIHHCESAILTRDKMSYGAYCPISVAVLARACVEHRELCPELLAHIKAGAATPNDGEKISRDLFERCQKDRGYCSRSSLFNEEITKDAAAIFLSRLKMDKQDIRENESNGRRSTVIFLGGGKYVMRETDGAKEKYVFE